MTPPPAARRHFHTLDGLRGVAAICVLMMHAAIFATPLACPRSYLAVDFFFALSGFVLVHAYAARLDRGMGVGRFTLLRLIRLYPLYILGTALGIAIALIATRLGQAGGTPPATMAAAIVPALLMLPTPAAWPMAGGWLFPFNVPSWSLFYELAVNIMLAVGWRRCDGRLAAAAMALSAGYLCWVTVQRGQADLGATWATLGSGMARAIFSFLVGIALARLPRRPVRVTPLAWLLPLALVATLIVPRGVGAWYDLLCILCLYPALLHVGAMVEPRSTALFSMLGATSFALYALHGPVLMLTIVANRVAHLALERWAPWPGLAFAGMMLAIAWAADRCYDAPVRRRLGAILPGRAS